MPCVIKVNGFPEPAALKENILNEMKSLEDEELVNTVLYV